MGAILQSLKSNVRQYGMVMALVLIVILFQFLTDGILLRPLNITNLILQNSYILILAIGMVLVIITGHIDLSVGSVAAFIGAMAAIMIVQYHMSVPVTIAACLLMGILIGAWQGFWIAYVGIPAFIVTLAGMLLFRGLTMVVLKGLSIGPFPESFQSMSTGYVPDLLHGNGLNVFSVVLGVIVAVLYVIAEWRARQQQKKYQLEASNFGVFVAKSVIASALFISFAYVLATYQGIPNILVIMFFLILIYSFVSNRTVIGRHIFATGGNLKAAMLSGIKTKRVTFMVFVNMGLLAALSGLVFAARLNSATPKAGNLFELDAIAACFIGGASAYGGVGTVAGAIIGGLVMGVMNNGMSIIGVSIDWQQAIKGLILLFAVGFDIYNKNRAA